MDVITHLATCTRPRELPGLLPTAPLDGRGSASPGGKLGNLPRSSSMEGGGARISSKSVMGNELCFHKGGEFLNWWNGRQTKLSRMKRV